MCAKFEGNRIRSSMAAFVSVQDYEKNNKPVLTVPMSGVPVAILLKFGMQTTENEIYNNNCLILQTIL